jgi:hypothetical protein
MTLVVANGYDRYPLVIGVHVMFSECVSRPSGNQLIYMVVCVVVFLTLFYAIGIPFANL